jgi:hypothetical protein
MVERIAGVADVRPAPESVEAGEGPERAVGKRARLGTTPGEWSTVNGP